MKENRIFCSPGKKIWAVVLIIFVTVLCICRLEAEKRERHQIIAQFILLFSIHTQWESQENLKSFHILLISEDASLFKELREQTADKVLRKKPFKITMAKSLKNFDAVQLIYVDKDKSEAIPGILDAVTGKGILLVTYNYPIKSFTMFNIFDTPDLKIHYEINQENLDKQKLKVQPKLVVYGKDKNEVEDLITKTQLDLQTKEKKIVSLEQQLDSLNKKIQLSTVELKNKEDKIGRLQVKITTQQQLVNTQKAELRQLKDDIRKQQDKLLLQTRTLKAQKDRLESQKGKIDKHNKTLREQEIRIQEQKREILTREETLKEQGATIATQKNVLYLLGTVTLLVIALIITIFKGYRNKQKANQRLEEKRNKLQQTLDMLRFTKNQLEVAKDAAEAANRAKSEFLSNMSHELRTPLNSILGYSQLIRRKATCADSDLKGLDVILHSGNHLLKLINEVLDLSKVEAGKMDIQYSNFSLPNLLRDIVDIMQIQAQKKGIYFKDEFSGDLPRYVRGDPKRLDQVLLNLLGNAFKFTDKGGVTLAVSRVKEKNGSYHTGTDRTFTRKRIRFEIIDTGPGIEPAKQEEIFSAFTQVGDDDRKSGGTGLGLTISRELVQLMGGQLQVTSTPNKGSSFWFELMLKETPGSEEISGADYGKITGYKGEKRIILVVDDSRENRQFMTDLLQHIGFEVHTAVNGKDGLQKVSQYDPDLILLDLAMPEMDGLEMVQVLRKTPELKDKLVILVSASTSGAMQLECLQKGFDSFIPKPVKEKHLFDNLECFLHLEWIYKDLDSTETETPEPEMEISEMEIVPPPEKTLEKIYIHSKLYDYDGLSKILSDIEQTDRRYIPFAKKIRKLSDDFLMPEICDMIDDYREKSEAEEMKA